MQDTDSLSDSGLFGAARIWLFGTRYPGLRYGGGGSKKKRRFARVYAFAYEGHYYTLPRPMVILVRGKGKRAEAAGGSFLAARTGIDSKGFRFASDIRVWRMNRLEVTVCMDVEAGRLEELVLAPAVVAAEESGSGRSAAAGRSAAVGRSAMAARSAAAFRSAMIGPHHD